jgi:hypothetical protein
MADPKGIRYRTGPPFPPSTHLMFVAFHEGPCTVCRRPPDGKRLLCHCERCGLEMCWRCHRDHVTGSAERALIRRPDLLDDVLGLVVCQGCRS